MLGVINHAQQKAKGGMHKIQAVDSNNDENNEILRNNRLHSQKLLLEYRPLSRCRYSSAGRATDL